MGASFVATVYGLMSIVATFVVRPRITGDLFAYYGLLYWILATPLLFFAPDAFFLLAVAAIMLFVMGSMLTLPHRAAFYFVCLMAIPQGILTTVPLPGINNLLTLDSVKAAGIAVLVPAMFQTESPYARRHLPSVGICLIIFTLILSTGELRTENLTSSLRGSVDHISYVALPYIVLIRLLKDRDDIDTMFKAFLLVGLLFALIGILSQARSWNFYDFSTERYGVPTFADFRLGILRVAVTTGPTLVGYVLSLGFVAMEYFRARNKIGFLMVNFLRAAMLLCLIFTFGRGGWLAMFVGVATFYIFTIVPRSMRTTLILVGLVAVAVVISIFAGQKDLKSIDEFGTFDYRRNLIIAAQTQIAENPIFGDPLYLKSRNFAHLVQGQGIIDIVNYYIQIALQYGVIALAIFVAAFGFAIRALLNLGAIVHETDDRELEGQRAALLAMLMAYLTMIATNSNVSFVGILGIIVLAVSAAFVAAVRHEQSVKTPEPGQRPLRTIA